MLPEQFCPLFPPSASQFKIYHACKANFHHGSAAQSWYGEPDIMKLPSTWHYPSKASACWHYPITDIAAQNLFYGVNVPNFLFPFRESLENPVTMSLFNLLPIARESDDTSRWRVFSVITIGKKLLTLPNRLWQTSIFEQVLKQYLRDVNLRINIWSLIPESLWPV